MCVQADPGKVRQQLIAEGLELEEVGGDVQVVHTAAPKGEGLLELEEALMLQVLPLTSRSLHSLCFNVLPHLHCGSTCCCLHAAHMSQLHCRLA